MVSVRKGIQIFANIIASSCCWQCTGEEHPKVPHRRYQCLSTLERKHWTLEEKLSALVPEGWENLLMYNLESSFQHGMSGKWGEIYETLKRPCVDIYCLQEVRRKGQGAKMFGNDFKFLWNGGYKANGVGVIVAN